MASSSKMNNNLTIRSSQVHRFTTEIDYPLSFSNGDADPNLHEPNIVDEAEDEVSVEILDHFSQSTKTKMKSPTSLPSMPYKKIKPETSAKKCPTGQVEGNSKHPKEKESSSKGLPKLSFSNRPEAKRLSSASQLFQAEISSHHLKCGGMGLPKYFIRNIKQGTKEITLRLKVNNRWWC